MRPWAALVLLLGGTTVTGTVWPGFSVASTSARSVGVGVGLPATDVMSEPAWIPACAAGPPGATCSTSTPWPPLVAPEPMPR